MKYNKVSENDRQRIVAAHKNNEDWKSTARTLGINVQTAYRWLLKDQELPKKKGGSISRKSPEIMRLLTTTIENNASATLGDMKSLIMRDFNIDVCQNTVKNWLDGELFTVKYVRQEIININSPDNKIKRAEYLEHLFQCRSIGRTPVWIDETNYNLYCKRKQGRSKVGTRAAVLMPSSKGANLHCIGAMTVSNVVLFTTRRGSFKSADCLEWFNELIEACNQQGIVSPTFIIDNAPAHCRLEDLLNENQHIQIIRLAPYSYLLNPIELLWSVFKSHIKRSLREQMPDILNMTAANGLSMTERRMRAD
jgi:transposase